MKYFKLFLAQKKKGAKNASALSENLNVKYSLWLKEDESIPTIVIHVYAAEFQNALVTFFWWNVRYIITT